MLIDLTAGKSPDKFWRAAHMEGALLIICSYTQQRHDYQDNQGDVSLFSLKSFDACYSNTIQVQKVHIVTN